MAQKRPAPTRSRFQQLDDDGPRPKRRKARPSLEVVAPEATLCGLPDNILLVVMGLLDVHSLISLSRVCRRFHHLHGDEFIWSDVDLSEVSVRAKLDVRKLKKIISTYLPQSLWRVKLSSNAGSKPAVVTESLLNELFTKCPSITTIVLHKCDLTILSHDCKLFRSSSLESVSLVKCLTSLQWLEDIRPSWPNLSHLSLCDTVKTTDFDLKYIAECKDWSSSLRSLVLHGCYRVTSTGIKYLNKGLSNLQTLDVTDCPQVTPQVTPEALELTGTIAVQLTEKEEM